MRGSGTCELVFTDCEVPAEHLLGELDRGVKVLMSGLDCERIVAAAGAPGLMQAALDLALPYTRERRQFGQPIGDFQLVQATLADMYARLAASRALRYATAQAVDRRQLRHEDAAAGILVAAEAATANALDAIQLLGGNGYVSDCPAGRQLRDAKLYEIGAGTSEIRRMLIGRDLVRRS
jgi:isovaleryl-CoA dehydrogenase